MIPILMAGMPLITLLGVTCGRRLVVASGSAAALGGLRYGLMLGLVVAPRRGLSLRIGFVLVPGLTLRFGLPLWIALVLVVGLVVGFCLVLGLGPALRLGLVLVLRLLALRLGAVAFALIRGTLALFLGLGGSAPVALGEANRRQSH